MTAPSKRPNDWAVYECEETTEIVRLWKWHTRNGYLHAWFVMNGSVRVPYGVEAQLSFPHGPVLSAVGMVTHSRVESVEGAGPVEVEHKIAAERVVGRDGTESTRGNIATVPGHWSCVEQPSAFGEDSNRAGGL